MAVIEVPLLVEWQYLELEAEERAALAWSGTPLTGFELDALELVHAEVDRARDVAFLLGEPHGEP